MTFSPVMKQPADGSIPYIPNPSNGSLNDDPAAVSSMSIATSASNVEQVNASSKQDEILSLDQVILLQGSEQSADFTAFVSMLPSLVKESFPELLTIAKQFNPRASGALIRELYKQKKFDFELFSHYWNNYTPDSPYAMSLRRWTYKHASFPPSIVKHLDTFDKQTKSFAYLCDAIWLQRNLFPVDEKRIFCHYYLNYLIESKRFFDAECSLIEGKSCLTAQEFTDYFKYLDVKEPVEKDSNWVVPFKQLFHEALDTKKYEEAVYALMQIRRFLREGDGGLYFPALALTFLKALQQEEDKGLQEAALLQFDRLFVSKEEMSLWAAQPYLFTEGVVLYLQMTSAPVESCIIREICSLQSNLTYFGRDKWTLLLFKYLSQQSPWPQASLSYIKECFVKNPNFLDRYFSQNEDPEFLLNLSVLCLQNEIDDIFLEKCFEDKFKSILIQSFPGKTSAFIELYMKKNDLQNSSKVELVLKMIVLLGESKERFPLIKSTLDILLKVEKNVLQKNLSMAKGYVELFDILLENDSSICMDLLKKLDRINIDGLTECYKKYLEKLLNAGKFEDAFDFCNKFAHYVSDQEIIPYIQKEQLSAPSPILEKFILRYRTSFSPQLWIRFSLYLHRTDQSNIVIDYFRHTLGCLKKMLANKSIELNEEELSEMFALLNFCKGKISDKTLQQEACLVVPEYIVRYPLANKKDQIDLLGSFQEFALKQEEKRFIETFRSQASKLSEYNKTYKNTPVFTVLFPEYNELQEVKKMCSIEVPEGVLSLFARAKYYMDLLKNSEENEVRLQAVTGLSSVIPQILTKNLDNKNKELFQALLNDLMSKNSELLWKINHYQWLETVFLSPHKNTLHFFQNILDLALKCISEVDACIFLFEKLSEYMEVNDTILDDNIRALLNTNSLPIEERTQILYQVLSYGCSHIQRIEIQHKEDVLFVGIKNDSLGVYSGIYLTSCLNAITEYMHLMEKPEPFVPLLKQIYEGVSYVLAKEQGTSITWIVLERKEKQNLINKFLKKFENYQFDAAVKWAIIKHFIFTFAYHLDTVHELASQENKIIFSDSFKCVDLTGVSSELMDEFMQFSFQLKYRSFLVENVNPPMDILIWKEKAQEAVLSDTKYYSQIILEKIEAKSYDNLASYIRCLKLGIFKDLKNVDKNNLKAFFAIFEGLMRNLRVKGLKFPTDIKAEFQEIYNRLSFVLRGQLVSSTQGWENQEKESFLCFICELTLLMAIEAENIFETSFHADYRECVGYIINAKGSTQPFLNEDVNKFLNFPVMANYLTFSLGMLKKSIKEKKIALIESYIDILEKLFAEIKDSKTYKKVFEQENVIIAKAMNLYLNARFGNYEAALTRIRLAYLGMMATPEELKPVEAFKPLEITKSTIDESSLHIHKEALTVCKDFVDDLNTLLNFDYPFSEDNLKQFESILDGPQTDFIERISWEKIVLRLLREATERTTIVVAKILQFFAKDKAKCCSILRLVVEDLLTLPLLREDSFNKLLVISRDVLQLSLKERGQVFEPVFKEFLVRSLVEKNVPYENIIHRGAYLNYDLNLVLDVPKFFAKNIEIINVLKDGPLLVQHMSSMQYEQMIHYSFERFKEAHTFIEKYLANSSMNIEQTLAIAYYWKWTLKNIHTAWRRGYWDQNYESILLEVHAKLLKIVKEKNLQRDFIDILGISMEFALVPLENGLDLTKKFMCQLEDVYSGHPNFLKLIEQKKEKLPAEGCYRFKENFEKRCVKLSNQIAVIQSLNEIEKLDGSFKSLYNDLNFCEIKELPGQILSISHVVSEIVKIKDNELKEALFLRKENLQLIGRILGHMVKECFSMLPLAISKSYACFLRDMAEIIACFSIYYTSFELKKWNDRNLTEPFLLHISQIFKLKKHLRRQAKFIPDQVGEMIKNEPIYLHYIQLIKEISCFPQNEVLERKMREFLEDVFGLMSASDKNPDEKEWVSKQWVALQPLFKEWKEMDSYKRVITKATQERIENILKFQPE